jgi:hypothetical protein
MSNRLLKRHGSTRMPPTLKRLVAELRAQSGTKAFVPGALSAVQRESHGLSDSVGGSQELRSFLCLSLHTSQRSGHLQRVDPVLSAANLLKREECLSEECLRAVVVATALCQNSGQNQADSDSPRIIASREELHAPLGKRLGSLAFSTLLHHLTKIEQYDGLA